MAGLTAQLVELSATGKELDRFPDLPFTGDNGSPIPFDTPCSATFLGTKVLVANQSAIAGDAGHQAILAVEVGERGRATYLPKPPSSLVDPSALRCASSLGSSGTGVRTGQQLACGHERARGHGGQGADGGRLG